MPEQRKGIWKSYIRRGIGVLLFLLPFGIITCSLVGSPFQLGKNHLPLMGLSVALMAMALLLGSLNFYLSYIRPALDQHRTDYRFVSGIPLIGTLLVIVGTIVGWSATLPAVLGVVALLLDTGGLPWGIVMIWSDASFWDSPE